jgi:hypothetical protein
VSLLPPGPPTSRGLRPRNAALRFSQLGAGFARLPQKGGYTPPFTPRMICSTSRLDRSRSAPSTRPCNLTPCPPKRGSARPSDCADAIDWADKCCCAHDNIIGTWGDVWKYQVAGIILEGCLDDGGGAGDAAPPDDALDCLKCYARTIAQGRLPPVKVRPWTLGTQWECVKCLWALATGEVGSPCPSGALPPGPGKASPGGGQADPSKTDGGTNPGDPSCVPTPQKVPGTGGGAGSSTPGPARPNGPRGPRTSGGTSPSTPGPATPGTLGSKCQATPSAAVRAAPSARQF